ncbi:MAG: hypothetical protein ACMUIG_01070 [Thermoplasmatota archaeon]
MIVDGKELYENTDDAVINIDGNDKQLKLFEDDFIDSNDPTISSMKEYSGYIEGNENSRVKLFITPEGNVGGNIDDGNIRYRIQPSNDDTDKFEAYKTPSLIDDEHEVSTDNTEASTRSIFPEVDISVRNKVYYLCRVQVYWDKAFNDAYTSPYFMATNYVAWADDYFIRDLNIKLFIYLPHSTYIPGSEGWDYSNVQNTMFSFQNFASPNIDDGTNPNFLSSIYKGDRAVMLSGTAWGFTMGYSSGQYCLVAANIRNANGNIISGLGERNVAHELGHTFALGSTSGPRSHYEADGLPAGDTENELINGAFPIMHQFLNSPPWINEFNWKATNVANAHAPKLRWRYEVYESWAGMGQAQMVGGIKLHFFRSWYYLVEDTSYTFKFNMALWNTNSYNIVMDKWCFKIKDYNGNVNQDLIWLDKSMTADTSYVHGGTIQFTSSGLFKVWPYFEYDYGGNQYTGPNDWQSSSIPAFGNTQLGSNQNTQSDVNLRMGEITIYGPSNPASGQVLFIEFHYWANFAPFDLDMTTSPNIFVKAIDPSMTIYYLESGDLRLHRQSGTYLFRSWIEVDQTGTWSFEIGYTYGGGTTIMLSPINIIVN